MEVRLVILVHGALALGVTYGYITSMHHLDDVVTEPEQLAGT